MGNKSTWSGNDILYFIAAACLITAVSLAGCATVQDKIGEIRSQQQLQRYRENLARGFFETVIKNSMAVIRDSETTPPADSAFYALGEVYAHHDYPGRDYNVSQYYFEKLIKNFPQSPLTAEAKTYISLFQTIEEKKKQAAQTEAEPAPAARPGKLFGGENFQEAAQHNMRILQTAGDKKPADEALYNLGLIYAHEDNPAKSYKKSQGYFHILTQQFPESQFAEEARVILGLFKTIEKIQQIDIDIEQQKKELIR